MTPPSLPGFARGVYLAPVPFEGTVDVLAYDLTGRRVFRAELPADAYTAASYEALVALLDAIDPVGAAATAPVVLTCERGGRPEARRASGRRTARRRAALTLTRGGA